MSNDVLFYNETLKRHIDFNEMIRKETIIEDVIIPLRDGLMLIRKKEK